jgi:EAL domain-containing protein (putative c-di-GMP-specific phosphodiesterase class I)
MGCDEMQGYLFGKPVPVEVFERQYMSFAPTHEERSG